MAASVIFLRIEGGEIAANTFSITIDLPVGLKTVEDQAVVVYPVPAADEINIRMVNEYRGQVNFRLINAAGQSVLIEAVNKNNPELSHLMSVGHVSSGVHFLQIS